MPGEVLMQESAIMPFSAVAGNQTAKTAVLRETLGSLIEAML